MKARNTTTTTTTTPTTTNNNKERKKEKNKEKKREKRKERQVLGPCQKTKKAVEHEGDVDTSCNWHTWDGPQRLVKGVGRVGNRRRRLRRVLNTGGFLLSLRLQ